MGTRNARAAQAYIGNPEQKKLLEDLLVVIEKRVPFQTLDALEVLTIMLATLVTTHCSTREHAEIVMSRIVQRMDDVITREIWAEEHPELRRH